MPGSCLGVVGVEIGKELGIGEMVEARGIISHLVERAREVIG